MLGLYIHIPFCASICSYCNFNRGLFDAALKTRYVAALVREIREAADRQAVDTIFFGGGTPSLLDPQDIGRIIDACRSNYGVTATAEVTLEANPETVDADRLRDFSRAGINRISFGAQSFDNGQLARLGRAHDARRIGEAVEAARRAGFDNLSLDLMFWLPGQDCASWTDSLSKAIALSPEHLSLYLLELYPNAPLRDTMARASLVTEQAAGSESAAGWAQAADDVAADMYLDALDRLTAAGYEQYEISNVARPGFESRHNLKYWSAGRWRGFGCGAHSTVDGQRWHNVNGTGDYVERIETGRGVSVGDEVLDADRRLAEALFTGLRLTAGIDRSAFAATFGLDPWASYGEKLRDAFDAGLVWQRGDRFGLTRPGMLLANEVLTAFV